MTPVNANVAVTFSADSEQRKALQDILGALARIVFISDLPQEHRENELTKADVLISWSPTRELQPQEFKSIAQARMMQLLSAGANHVPFSQIPSSLLIAANVGAYAEQMAEHILAMALAVSKNLLDRHEKLKQGVFDQSGPNRLLQGSTCAILGFGGIGRATARLLRCFGVKIYALNTTGTTTDPVDFIGTLKDLQFVLHLADIVIITLPLTNTTRRLIADRELAWMKDDAILVNVARGPIIDEKALYERLKGHPNFTAAIDAWWIEPIGHGEFRTNYPFLELPNVLGSPHNSGIVPGSSLTATRVAAANVKRFLKQEPIHGIVNRSDYERHQ